VLERQIRAFSPWPVCWFELNGNRIRVWDAEVIDDSPTGQAGDVIAASADGIDVSTTDGILRLTEVQRAGGTRMPVANYLNAHPISISQ
jgi:methionyl-tRNA formyltransferase